MKIGENGIILFRILDLDLQTIDKIIFTFQGVGKVQKFYPSQSVSNDHEKFFIGLTQEDTLILAQDMKVKVSVEAQINFKSGAVVKTDNISFMLEKTLYTELVAGNEPSINVQALELRVEDGTIVIGSTVEVTDEQIRRVLPQNLVTTDNFATVCEDFMDEHPEYKGEKGDPGENGQDGADGKSAYDIAVEQGFSGTVTEWLASLKGTDGINGTNGQDGADGQDGNDGKSAFEYAEDAGYDGTEQEFAQKMASAISQVDDTGSLVIEDGVLSTNNQKITGRKNVKDFGAVGDGETDDTTAIQNALNGGGVIYFPEGHYIVSPLQVSSNSVLIGEKGKSIIEIIDSIDRESAVISLGAASVVRENVYIGNLTIRGTETYGSAQGGLSLIDAWRTTGLIIENCLFQNNMYAAIRIMRGTNSVIIRGCRFEACDVGIGSLGTISVNDVVIMDCFFTGLSSYNNFTNFNSEQITIYNEHAAGCNRRWLIKDCEFEHKKTNVICMHESWQVADGVTDALCEDIVIKNIRVRDCVGAVVMTNAANITIDGIYFEKTDSVIQENGVFQRVVNITRNCKNVTIHNIVCMHDAPASAHFQVTTNSNSDILIDNVRVWSNGTNKIATLRGSGYNVENFIAYATNSNSNPKVLLDQVTNSYFDIRAAIDSPKGVQYQLESADTVTGNVIVIDVSKKTMIYRNGVDFNANADTNTYRVIDDTLYSTNVTGQINTYRIAKNTLIRFETATQYNDAMTTNKNYRLLEEGHEMVLRFKRHPTVGDVEFTFPTDGNIIPINEPFKFSRDYEVVCYFKQINAKWVELKRELEYYAGYTVDVTPKQIPAPTTVEATAIQGNSTIVAELTTKVAATAEYIVKLHDAVTSENYYLMIANGKLVTLTDSDLASWNP